MLYNRRLNDVLCLDPTYKELKQNFMVQVTIISGIV